MRKKNRKQMNGKKENKIVNNGVKKRIELEGFGCVHTVFSLVPHWSSISLWFVTSHSYVILPFPWPHYIHKRPFDLNMHMYRVLILEACQVYLCLFSWMHWVDIVYLRHLRETLIVCICEVLLLLIHLLNWLIILPCFELLGWFLWVYAFFDSVLDTVYFLSLVRISWGL